MWFPDIFPILPFLLPLAQAHINRQDVVSQFNPVRTAYFNSTPMQVGNGDFAFGVDVTGLQTFQSFATMSSWGWHNFSLPTAPGESSVEDFRGLDWWTHGRLVNYNQPNPSQNLISNWLIQNPQRINLGRIGFWFGEGANLTQADISAKNQTLDLYSGVITSTFNVFGSEVSVKTAVDPASDTVALSIKSKLLNEEKLGVFFDFPYPKFGMKFDYPDVGRFDNVSSHVTTLKQTNNAAQITHTLDSTTYYTTIEHPGSIISGPLPSSHRYILKPSPDSSELDLTVNYSPTKFSPSNSTDAQSILKYAARGWSYYWESGAFISLPTSVPEAKEVLRRTILSQYLLAVNGAGTTPPQESGLVNNGWYGKFHLEMIAWHLTHWRLWKKPEFLNKSVPGLYTRFLQTSKDRAKAQGYAGAKWGKMTDPSGSSAPGEINSLLIWQQPHVMWFAELEYRDMPCNQTLQKWDEILHQSAEYMASMAWYNSTTKHFDLGPPMYPVSENTNPNATINPVFELAYWRFGLTVALNWKRRQGQNVPRTWTNVLNNLAPLPIVNETYPIYEGVPEMWIDPVTFTDHPAMIGIYGLLPPTPDVNLTIVANTATKISEIWDFENLFGWDFPMLAMNAARLGRSEQAIKYLLDVNFDFDDVGMPIGGPRVPTPYFPGSSSLLMAIACMAGGWDGDGGSHFPEGWDVESEGFWRCL